MMNETYEKLVLTEAAFTNLYEYSLSLPTGTTAGKRWKRRYGEKWLIGEYLNPENGDIEIKWWEPIVLSEEELNQLVSNHDRDITVLKDALEKQHNASNQKMEKQYTLLYRARHQRDEYKDSWEKVSKQLGDRRLSVGRVIDEFKTRIANQAKTIDCLREHLKPFVEKLIHERDYGRWGNPTGWCQKCELEDVLDTGEKP